jgi:hypothetical protein
MRFWAPTLTCAPPAELGRGTIGLFLPFTWGTSPWDAISDGDLWQAGVPAFLAVLASAGSIRWMISGSFSAVERVIAYIAGASMAGVSLSPLVEQGVPSFTTLDWQDWKGWLVLAVPVLVLAVGIGFLFRNSRTARSSQFNPVMSVQVAYVAHAAMWLLVWYGHWDVGAYFVLVATLAFVIQMVLVSAQLTRPPATGLAR